MGCNKNSSKRELYSNTILYQETIKTLNRQPSFTPETTGERRKKITKVSRRKELTKIPAKRNERNNSED